MNIDRTNYEVFFLDYFERNLNDEQCQCLMVFLEENPDLKHEFDLFDFIGIDDADIHVFVNKDSLKKTEDIQLAEINHSNYNDFFIACHEGDLTEKQKTKTYEFIEQNPSVKQDFEIYFSLKLEPEANVVFAQKNILKRKTIVYSLKRFIIVGASVAAIFIIALFALNTFQLSNDSMDMTADVHVDGKLPEFNERVENIDYYIENIQLKNTVSNKSIINKQRQPLGQIPPKMQPLMQNSIPTNVINFTIAETTVNEYYEIYKIKAEKCNLFTDENYLYQTKNERLFDKVIKILRNSSEIENKINEIDAWQLAQYGIKGFNVLTDNDVEFIVKRNDDGKVNKISFNQLGIPIWRNM